MKGWETSSSKPVGGLRGGRRPCLYRKGAEPRKRQPEIVPAAGKSEWRRPGSEQTSNLASGAFGRGEIFGHRVPQEGGGGSQEDPVAWEYASGSILSLERRNPLSLSGQWPLYDQRLPVRLCCWCSKRVKIE